MTVELEKAVSPEDLFGTDATLDLVKAEYRKAAKQYHPDTPNGSTKLFQKLQKLYDGALKKLNNGTYGDGKPIDVIATIRTKTNAYSIYKQVSSDIIATVYSCTDASNKDYYFKIAKHPKNNNLLSREALVLRDLNTELINRWVPVLNTEFSYRESGTNAIRQAEVLEPYDDFYSLAQVKEAYPNGIDAKDVAWIFRRILMVLEVAMPFAEHGSIDLDSILINPSNHNLLITNWYGLKKSKDLLAAGECMEQLLDAKAPWQMRTFIKGCKFSSPDLGLLGEFDELLNRLWGKRTFHEFSMPKGSK